MKEGIVFEIKKHKAIIMTNEGEFLSVPANSNWQIGNIVRVNDIELKSHQSSQKRTLSPIAKHKKMAIALVASLLLLILPLTSITQASTIISLDINPSLELKVKDDEVTKVTALNEDGEALLAQIDETEGNVYEVTSLILDKAYELGYLKSNEQNYIMIGVLNEKDFETEDFEQFVEQNMEERNIEVEVLTLNASKDEKKIAEDKGISVGRSALQLKEKNDGIKISDEQIKNENVKEIMNIINEEKIKKEKETNKDKDQDNNNDNNLDKDKNENDNNNENNNGNNGTDKNNSSKKNETESDKDKPENSDKKSNSDNLDSENSKNETQNDTNDKTNDKVESTDQTKNSNVEPSKDENKSEEKQSGNNKK